MTYCQKKDLYTSVGLLFRLKDDDLNPHYKGDQTGKHLQVSSCLTFGNRITYLLKTCGNRIECLFKTEVKMNRMR